MQFFGKQFLLLLLVALIPASCAGQLPKINTTHLDHLYEEVRIETGDTVGIIHIYAEYPDYHYVGDDDEGVACVDDATRAAIFYLKHYKVTSDSEYLRKAKMLMRFILALQSDNGYFYNFIWDDGTIHRDGITTINEPNWWSWRALWCLSEFIQSGDFASDPWLEELVTARDKLVDKILSDKHAGRSYYTVEGISIPEWLPGRAATDQAALIILGMAPMLSESENSELQRYLKDMADGIIDMQVNSPGNWTDGAFLSWRNLWHGYGNSQAYALLLAGDVLNDDRLTSAAMKEADEFYPALWDKGWLSSFQVRNHNGNIEAFDIKQFDQIAYAMRPAIFGAAQAYKTTKDVRYKVQAEKLFEWFTGNNPAGINMYDAATGRGYDGISNAEFVNYNSGAESTVEALLALQMLHSINQN